MASDLTCTSMQPLYGATCMLITNQYCLLILGRLHYFGQFPRVLESSLLYSQKKLRPKQKAPSGLEDRKVSNSEDILQYGTEAEFSDNQHFRCGITQATKVREVLPDLSGARRDTTYSFGRTEFETLAKVVMRIGSWVFSALSG